MKRATRHERHNHPKTSINCEGAIGIEDIRVRKQRHRLGFAAKAVKVSPRLIKIDGFDGNDR